MAEASVVQMLCTLEGVVGVQGVKPHEALMSLHFFHADTCLSYDSLGDMELSLQGVYLSLDVEDVSVGLVKSTQLAQQAPVIDLSCHVHNLVEGCGVPLDVLEEPHRKGLGGLVNAVST